jgi:RNA polymerase sigma-70 factor, ECF subfamily
MSKSINKYSDSELLELLRGDKKQSEAAFTVLYNRYSSKVFSYCKCILFENEQSKDIFQETFIKFYKSASEGAYFSNVLGYLIKIARNLCLNYKRDKKVHLSIDEFDIFIDEVSIRDEKELFELVLMAIDLMDLKHKEVFVMNKIDGISYEEISEILDISLSAVRSRVKRSKMKIIEILEPYLKDYCN